MLVGVVVPREAVLALVVVVPVAPAPVEVLALVAARALAEVLLPAP